MWYLLFWLCFMLFLAACVAIAIGLVSPRRVKKTTRWKAFRFYGLAAIAFFVLSGVAAQFMNVATFEPPETTESPTPSPEIVEESPDLVTPEILAEANQVYTEMVALLAEGREMEALRNPNNLEECGNQMRSRQARVDKLVAQIDEWGLPQVNSIRSSLSVPTGNLKICVNCTPRASEACDWVEDDLPAVREAIGAPDDRSETVPLAKPDKPIAVDYEVVQLEDVSFPGRQRFSASIVAPQATSFEQRGETAIAAARQIQLDNAANVVTVFLVPDKASVGKGLNLAIARYAPDGGGYSGDQEWKWEVKASPDPISDQGYYELEDYALPE